MQYELNYLYGFLLISFILAPHLTNCLLLGDSKIYRTLHLVSLVIVLLGIFLKLNEVLAVWFLFCIFGLWLHFRNEVENLWSLKTIATFIPFVFSVIASVWLVAGTNDLFLLGYDKHWSFYAALHSNFLGWIFLGCLTFLSKRSNSKSIFYTVGCYVCFIFFLMIAFGINGVPYIKSIGTLGLSLVVPFFIGLYFLTTVNRASKILASFSLVGVLFSMTLAVLNEFSSVTPQFFLGAASMVTLHGLINSLLVTPFFFFAIKLEEGKRLCIL